MLEKKLINYKDLISVVVPIYKVEEYLDQTVKSIIGQSYSHLEIILVDDGSPDNCGKICDDWAKRDSRIIVIHKQNGGLSSARNAGIKRATGKYIGFVDSDDFIAPDAIENLLSGFCRYPNVGIVAGMIKRFNDGDEINVYDYRKEWIVKEDKLIDSEHYLKSMILETSSNIVCNKLFLTEIVKKTLFKEGRNNEDTLFDYYLSKQVEKMKLAYLDIPFYVYYYRKTPNSICHSMVKPLEIDIVANYQEMLDDPEGLDNDIHEIIYYLYTRRLTWLVDKLYLNPQWKSKYYSYYKSMLNTINNSYVIKKWPFTDAVLFYIIKYLPVFRSIQKKFL